MIVHPLDQEDTVIPNINARGRQADFHALGRNTPNTLLAAQDIPLQLRMDFMRHTEARLTTGTYIDARLLDKFQVDEALPWIEGKAPADKGGQVRARATGTEGGGQLHHKLHHGAGKTRETDGTDCNSRERPSIRGGSRGRP